MFLDSLVDVKGRHEPGTCVTKREDRFVWCPSFQLCVSLSKTSGCTAGEAYTASHPWMLHDTTKNLTRTFDNIVVKNQISGSEEAKFHMQIENFSLCFEDGLEAAECHRTADEQWRWAFDNQGLA